MYHFDNGSGVTADSLSYYRDNRHLLGQVIEARVHFPGAGGPYPYCFELADDQGNHMWLSGVTAGYRGEGPRGAMEILIDAGFDIDRAGAVLHDMHVVLQCADLRAAAMESIGMSTEPLMTHDRDRDRSR
jgi:hypothetical protein